MNTFCEILEKIKVDDTVGAWPVHGLCGIWGGIATGIFGGHPLLAQMVGSIVIPIWAFVTMYVLFAVLKGAGMLRITEEEEMQGLDITEHGGLSYPEFIPGSAASSSITTANVSGEVSPTVPAA